MELYKQDKAPNVDSWMNEVKQLYGFPASPIEGRISSSGTYISPYQEDPDLFPFIELVKGDLTFRQYPYAIIAFSSPTKTIITRMD